MNTGASKTSFLLVILVSTLQCNCQENKILSLIYAKNTEVLVRDSISYNTSRQLTNFGSEVTGLAIHGDYLYASAKHEDAFFDSDKKNSMIYRVKIINSSIFKIDYDSWEEFHKVPTFGIDILSMVIANNCIYSGRSDRIMWRCSTDVKGRCTNFNELFGPITKIAYSPAGDDQIYAVENGPNKDGNRVNALNRCSPHKSGSFSLVVPIVKKEVTVLKAAFDEIWLGTSVDEYWKCPLNHTRYSSPAIERSCYRLEEFRKSGNLFVGDLDMYSYVNLAPGDHIWRCDAKETCNKAMETPNARMLGPYMFVEK